MAAFARNMDALQKLVLNNPVLLRQAARSMAGWNKDFKPAPFPVTDKQQAAAAKKYNMQPEEYKPYADDGLGTGDYPDLGHSYGIESKDNYYPYDYPEHKRNFNEIVHAEIDFYGEDRYSQPERPRLTNRQYWGTFLGVMGSITAFYYWLEDKKMYPPVAAKQYPSDGKTHYTF